MKKFYSFILIVLTFNFVSDTLFAQKIKTPKQVLIFTKNGEGFVHENIAESVEAWKYLAGKHKFKVEISDDASVFTPENLDKYRFVIFSNTNNVVFENNEQRLAFRRYIEAGGGFIGIHSALGTERNWLWFNQLLGGSFVWHPKKQTLYLSKISQHNSIQNTPSNWIWEDECYFSKIYYPGISTLLVADLNKIDSSDQNSVENYKTSFGNLHPVSWFQYFDGGTSWLTTLGHNPEAYTDPTFLKHLEDGFKFLMSSTKRLDYSKSYAIQYDEELIFK